MERFKIEKALNRYSTYNRTRKGKRFMANLSIEFKNSRPYCLYVYFLTGTVRGENVVLNRSKDIMFRYKLEELSKARIDFYALKIIIQEYVSQNNIPYGKLCDVLPTNYGF